LTAPSTRPEREINGRSKVHYFTLKTPWLPDDTYRQLIAVTIDKRNHWDPKTQENTFYIFAHKIPDAERILGRPIAIKTRPCAELDAEIAKRPKQTLTLAIDATQEVIIASIGTKTHSVRFAYISTLWRRIKTLGAVRPRELWEELEQLLDLPKDTFYKNRAMYYTHFYWPVVVLKTLSLIDQSGTGPIVITAEGVRCTDWQEKIGTQL
jgi:hypothetical protein